MSETFTVTLDQQTDMSHREATATLPEANILNNIVDFGGLLLPVPTVECIISHYRSNRPCT